jgi:spore germination protein KC
MKKIIILLLPFLLTGCWNYRELNDMAIASAIAIKRENDKFVVSVQIMNSKKGSSSGSSSTGGDSTPISVLTAEGETIHEAIRNISLISPRQVYIGHMDLLVLDEKIAYNGINEIIDFFMRDPESRKQFKVIISKNNDPGELIKILTPLENIPSKDLVAGLKTSNKIKSSIIEVIYDELLSNIYSEGFEAVLRLLE